jgi:hypothetical protein
MMFLMETDNTFDSIMQFRSQLYSSPYTIWYGRPNPREVDAWWFDSTLPWS